MALHPAERLAVGIIGTLLTIDLILIATSGVAIDWAGYAVMFVCGAAIFGLGLGYRMSGRDEKIALTGIAAGAFILFTIVASIFNYLLLPFAGDEIDLLLINLDARLGLSWPQIVEAAAQWPTIAKGLGYVYMSSLFQLAFLIIALGLTGRARELHCFLVTGIVAIVGSILFWVMFPSSSPTGFMPIDPVLVERIGMVVTPDYGAELIQLLEEGASYVSPHNVLGLIAFPSVHTVMALMCVWFARPLKMVFPVFLVLNIVMVPAIVIHGGHYVVDLFGGAVAFALSVWIASAAISRVGRHSAPLTVRAPVTAVIDD